MEPLNLQPEVKSRLRGLSHQVHIGIRDCNISIMAMQNSCPLAFTSSSPSTCEGKDGLCPSHREVQVHLEYLCIPHGVCHLLMPREAAAHSVHSECAESSGALTLLTPESFTTQNSSPEERQEGDSERETKDGNLRGIFPPFIGSIISRRSPN